MKMHARTESPFETAASWPEEIFAILQRFDVRPASAEKSQHRCAG
jgi:hypothetical protein